MDMYTLQLSLNIRNQVIIRKKSNIGIFEHSRRLPYSKISEYSGGGAIRTLYSKPVFDFRTQNETPKKESVSSNSRATTVTTFVWRALLIIMTKMKQKTLQLKGTYSSEQKGCRCGFFFQTSSGVDTRNSNLCETRGYSIKRNQLKTAMTKLAYIHTYDISEQLLLPLESRACIYFIVDVVENAFYAELKGTRKEHKQVNNGNAKLIE